uniref:Hemolymph juvenile hormone binding protein n=1 Tax=Glossina brevipalpis TaxID=37001 RepID=A0A1A9WU10_9MUSC
MKSLIILTVLLAFAASQKEINPLDERSISSAVVEVIEGLRDEMPCGFPAIGIPPLAPLKLNHKELNINFLGLNLNGAVDKFRLTGLNDFEIAEMKVNALASKVIFRFIFYNISVDTMYDIQARLRQAGLTVNLIGAGHANFAVKDMHIWGVLKYSFNLISGKLKIKGLEIRTHIGDVESDIQGILGTGLINRKMNALLSEAVELLVNTNEDMITENVEALAVPIINSFLDKFTVGDIVGAIGGGGEGEKEPCKPEEVEN